MISKGMPRRGSEATKRGEGVGGGIPSDTREILHFGGSN